MAIDLNDDRIAGSSVNVNLWFRAGRNTWPMLSRFDARLISGGRSREIHLVRGFAAECVVRPVLVVPLDDEICLVFEFRLVLGHCHQTHDLFERAMEPFNDANSTEPRANGTISAIASPRTVPELRTLVRDDVFRRAANPVDCLADCCLLVSERTP